MTLSDFDDMIQGLKRWQMALWLASEDLASRYTRTFLGPWWNVLSQVLYVGALSVTFGMLFGQPLREFLPYIAAGLACWAFINGILVEGTTALVRASGMIGTYSLPLSVFVYRSIIDKFFNLAHFLCVYALVVVLLRIEINPLAIAMFIPALFLYAGFATGISLALSVLGARFRDLTPAISSIMILFFLITPVFWNKTTLIEKNHWIADYNPFFHFLEIGRNPLLGKFASIDSWIFMIVATVLSLIVGGLVFAAMRRKIYYWV